VTRDELLDSHGTAIEWHLKKQVRCLLLHGQNEFEFLSYPLDLSILNCAESLETRYVFLAGLATFHMMSYVLIHGIIYFVVEHGNRYCNSEP
jgi:hypothetical protein